jgi:hypothetical protein
MEDNTMTKFLYNGIKHDGELFKAHYSIGPYTAQSKLPEGTITIYASDYKSFPFINELTTINESDSMTDYFEKDRIRVQPSNKWYEDVYKAYQKQEEHRQQKLLKRDWNHGGRIAIVN